jgi:hypothetical protein
MTTKTKTASTAQAVGLRVFTLLNWVRYGLVPPPERDCSGHYWWGPEDIAAVRHVLADRNRRHSRRNHRDTRTAVTEPVSAAA